MILPENIVLRGYPVRLGALESEHVDEVVREFQLIALSRPGQSDHRGQRLLALVAQLAVGYAVDRAGPDLLRDQALAQGRPTVDLVFAAGPESRSRVQAWTAMWQEVETYCRTDDLLALAAPNEVVALREWVLAQFLTQLDGQDPRAWTGPV